MLKFVNNTFVHEMPLKTTHHADSELDTRLDAARQLYNACLGYYLNLIQLIKQSKTWQEARKLKKTEENKSKRRQLFNEAKKFYGFSEYELHAFATNTAKKCWIDQHLDSFTMQKIASQAFIASEQYLFSARGKPRFKGYGRMRSVEGKKNTNGIRYKDSNVIWNIRNLYLLGCMFVHVEFVLNVIYIVLI